MKTSIVIATYNKLEILKLCIESIEKFTDPQSYEIIVIDNNSSDGTVNWLKNKVNIKKIFNDTNKGFPIACNQGINISNYENILLLNNDVIASKNWLNNLLTCLYSNTNIGAVGCVTNYCSNFQSISINYNNIEEYLNFAENYNKSDSKKWEERPRLIGFCLLIKKSILNEVGILDERFSPGNFEDDDLCLRIRLAGYRLMLAKDTFVHHFGSTSFGEDAIKFQNLLNINLEKFLKKWNIKNHEEIFDLNNIKIDYKKYFQAT
ncbi:MAG: glycosyltransferase family 2 protein [Caulobacteraceae bacterium]|nr:glycosyltransferase family 2 protein [Caulobacteraceae bacterium]